MQRDVVVLYFGRMRLETVVVGLVAGEASDGRGVLAKENIGARDRMPFDGVIELVSFVEV